MSMSAEAYRQTIRERDFTAQVIAEAEAAGWLVYHIPDWMYQSAFASWQRTGNRAGRRWPMRGFPDLVLSHPERHEVLFVEVKTRYGRQSHEQQRWAAALVACGLRVELWRPADWPSIEHRLKGAGE
ncbi:MAG TPA: VRR-NUC domain-containing protein [Tepidisphaeraceae bacterium]|jgi:hypothetical protein